MRKKQQMDDSLGKDKTPRKIWQKWWFWVIIVVVALGIFAGGGDSEPAESQDIAAKEENKPAEPQDMEEKEKEPEEAQTEADKEPLSPDEFVKFIKKKIKGQVGEGEVIKDVKLKDTDLRVYVDLSQVDPAPMSLEDLALTRVASIAEKILEFSEYDDLWETITVDYGDLGYVTNSKDDIKESEYGRYFPQENFKLETNITEGQKNQGDDIPSEYEAALKSAESYSELMNMSKAAIYDQLISEYGDQFTEEAAQYAIDNIVADWNENALKSAESYSESMHMSKAAIYDQLISEYGDKFTKEEAQYAIDNIVADWNENALLSAKNYQESMNMSPAAIYDQLISEYGDKFTEKEADYAIKHLK